MNKQPVSLQADLEEGSSLNDGPILIENIISGRKGLGADYSFAPNTLEVRRNSFGIRGIFNKVAISAGSNIISVPLLSGTLTEKRAYEEAAPLLRKLGPERFNLKDTFVQACALYQRYQNSSGNDKDILVLERDLESVYAGTPMMAAGSYELMRLAAPNNKAILEEGRRVDCLIDKLGVDSKLFRLFVAYCKSRSWMEYGLIPIMDLMNSSYGPTANCACDTEGGAIHYSAIRDIAVGEELTWSYNGFDAVNTWISYGYVDAARPSTADLQLQLDERSLERFLNFLKNHLGVNELVSNPKGKIDRSRFDFTLTYPGDGLNREHFRNEIFSSIQSFLSVVSSFRALALSGEKAISSGVTNQKLTSFENNFGIEIEIQAITGMQNALKDGADETRRRIVDFQSSEIGRTIDMAPFSNLKRMAHQPWEDIFSAVVAILSCPDDVEISDIMSRKFDISISSKEQAIQALKKLDSESPTMMGSILLLYLESFLRHRYLDQES